MKESYREGVANHPGPEPCEGGGNVALEALDRGICRLGMSSEILRFGELTASGSTEGNNAPSRKRERGEAPRSRNALSSSCAKTPSMQRNFMRENRETPLPPAGSGAGREEK